jgi:hypothetical protein
VLTCYLHRHLYGYPLGGCRMYQKLFEPWIMASDSVRVGQPVLEYIRHEDVKRPNVIKNFGSIGRRDNYNLEPH